MERVLLTDLTRIKGGVLRRIENRGSSPHRGDVCEVVLNDSRSLFGEVGNVWVDRQSGAVFFNCGRLKARATNVARVARA